MHWRGVLRKDDGTPYKEQLRVGFRLTGKGEGVHEWRDAMHKMAAEMGWEFQEDIQE